MTKTELVEKVAAETGMSKKDSGKAVDAVFSAITDSLAKKEKVQIVGFGTFQTTDRKARKGVKPGTKEPVEIPARTVPVFRAGKALKDSVR